MTDYGHGLQFGVFIAPSARSADHVVALSALAEEVGYDLVTFNDHPYSSGALDALTLMSFVAARTGRVHLAANVLSLPMRPPAVLARAVASLDILSHGRAELGIGAGMAWEAIETMGGRRLDVGDSVEALEEGIHVIRALWATGERGGVRFEGKHYRLAGALRGPAPVHDISIWVGAFKPRMLRLVGRLGDGWLPTIGGLKPGGLAAGNAIIDAAAAGAGRDPTAIRRLLNLGTYEAPAREMAAELARLALEDGISTFVVTANDPRTMTDFAAEVAPRVREAVEEARLRGLSPPRAAVGSSPVSASAQAQTATHFETEDERLGVAPTQDEGVRLSERAPWDESTRPHRDRSGPGELHRPGTSRRESADRGARPAPKRAVRAKGHPAAGPRRGDACRGRQSGAQRDGAPPERLDARGVLRPLLRRRHAAPRRRRRINVSAPCAPRAAAQASDRSVDRGAPRYP